MKWEKTFNIEKSNQKDDYAVYENLDGIEILEPDGSYHRWRIEPKDDFCLRIWDELTDIPFDVNSNKSMILLQDWFEFEKGTIREDIWRWFDENYSKGVGILLNCFGSQCTRPFAQATPTVANGCVKI